MVAEEIKPVVVKDNRNVIITRKIQLNFDAPKEELKELYTKIYGWQKICHKAANWIVTHHFMQTSLQDILYLSEGTKVKLANMEKDTDGILTTSRASTTYQLLSTHFKGECPMGMLSGLNTTIVKTYLTEAWDVQIGKKSLRTYRRDIPLPIRRGDVSHIMKHEDGNYSFTVYGLSFKTYFGKDLSRNEDIFDRAISDEYKWSDSSIQLDGGKMYLLGVFKLPKQNVVLDVDKEAICHLSPDFPIRVEAGKDRQKNTKFFNIGTKEEYLFRRIAIRSSLNRLQKALKYNKGGKGRKHKMQRIEDFKDLEVNYINTKMHQYSKQLIDYCIKRKVSKIVLKNYEEIKEAGKELLSNENQEPLFRSWSFSNLVSKIVYKAAKVGIEVIIEKKSEED